MRILIINTLYAPYQTGGAEVSVQLLAEQLAEDGHDVKVLSLHPEGKHEKNTINGVAVEYVALKNIYWPFSKKKYSKWEKIIWHLIDIYNPLMAKSVKKVIASFQPDLVHTNNLTGFSVAAWVEVKKKRLKLIHTARDYYLFHPNTTLFKNGDNMDENKFNVKFFSVLKKWHSQKIDVFIGISRYISQFHYKNGFAKKAKHAYIYNPIKMSEHIISRNIDNNHIIVGFIGRLTVEKGFDEFCCLAERYKNNSNMQFCAAGRFSNNEEGERLKSLAQGLNIKLMGFVAVTDFMASVDAVVLPIKWQEPFGRVVLEAALAGKAVFTTFQGGITELAQLCPGIYKVEEFSLEKIVAHQNINQYSLPSTFDKRVIAEQYVEAYEN